MFEMRSSLDESEEQSEQEKKPSKPLLESYPDYALIFRVIFRLALKRLRMLLFRP
jgi:hypothetical protein